MKFQIAFALLALCGAAQAGKYMDVASFGSGYPDSNQFQQFEGAGGAEGEGLGASVDVIARDTNEVIEQHSDDLKQGSEAYYEKANSLRAIAEALKNQMRYSHRQAENEATMANGHYKKAQFSMRNHKDKEQIAKSHSRQAQKYDALCKQEEMKEHDDYRKITAEHEEHCNKAASANHAYALGMEYHVMSQMERDMTTYHENQAKEDYEKAEALEKLAEEYKEKAIKEKEEEKTYMAKAKEYDQLVHVHESQYIEGTKKVHDYNFHTLNFLIQAESERHLAQYYTIRSNYLAQLSQYTKNHAQGLQAFSKLQYSLYGICKTKSSESHKQAVSLATASAHALKHQSYAADGQYIKKGYRDSSYQEA